MITSHAKKQIVYRLGYIVTGEDVRRMNSACLAFPEGKNYVIIKHYDKTHYRRGSQGDMLVATIEDGEVTTAMLSWNRQSKERWADGSRREFVR